jgi:Four helix bundle sensory module for signal transduction
MAAICGNPSENMKSDSAKRLFLAASVMALLLIVTSPVTTVWLIRHEATRIVSDSLQGLTTSSLATMNVSEGFLETVLAVHSGQVDAETLVSRLEASTRLVDEQYMAHRETLGGVTEIRAFERMLEARKEYRATRQQVISLIREGKSAEASDLFKSRCVNDFQDYADALGLVVERNANEAKSRGEQIILLCHVLMIVQVLLLGFFFIYGFFVPLTALWERLTRRPVEMVSSVPKDGDDF